MPDSSTGDPVEAIVARYSGLGPVRSSDHEGAGRLRSQMMAPRRWSPAS